MYYYFVPFVFIPFIKSGVLPGLIWLALAFAIPIAMAVLAIRLVAAKLIGAT